jgi:phage antirepressor YoqD-like protein
VGIFFGETEMQLATSNAAQTMSTRDIAELCGKEHKNVMRDADMMLEELGIDGAQFCASFKTSQGNTYACYHFDKELTLTLISGYSILLRHKIVKRMEELEAMQVQVHKVPQTLSEALRLAADQQDTIVAQAAQLEAQAPSVAYVENFVKCDGLIGIREAAKSLGLQQNAFVQMLVAAKIMFRENGHLQAYATDIEANRFAVKVTKDLSGKARSQTMLTAKGIRWVANKLELDKLFAND